MIARIAAFLLLFYILGYALFAVLLPGAGDDRRTDAIVVLTGGAKRLERGIDLLQRGRAERMLISGVDRAVRPSELAARYKAEQRLFDCCIDLGREAVDTRSNAEETANWLERHKFKSVRLVTTDWHMPRARLELSRKSDGLAIVTDAIESSPRFRTLFTEYNKFVLRQAAILVGI
ncbi:MAG TPA: YdcF family protein [Allosphingosinicella sp.]|uniref:YdcF family protein n=1 Tax=Allosphingosinicella sp. TaxID=2823234 RepID=UPI002F2A566C